MKELKAFLLSRPGLLLVGYLIARSVHNDNVQKALFDLLYSFGAQ